MLAATMTWQDIYHIEDKRAALIRPTIRSSGQPELSARVGCERVRLGQCVTANFPTSVDFSATLRRAAWLRPYEPVHYEM